MKKYRRLAGDSGVLAYALGAEAIRVKFMDGKVYTYSYASCGRAHVEQMTLLAEAGRGLSTYISKYVRERYESS
ncbi:MAG: hypothetical protein WKG03_13720 [Telluria sp.]